MLEVEMKFPVTDHQRLQEQLQACGARQRETRTEIDHYFDAPDRDFAQTDEALRLRRIGDQNFLTYKGPKLDRLTKTRTEIEVPLAPGPHAAELATAFLEHLGFRAVATLRKRRTLQELLYEGYVMTICLDQVDGVGAYVELETLAADDQLDAARQAVLALAQELSLANSERRSYLELWLARRAVVSSQ